MNRGLRMTLGTTREWHGNDGRHYRSEQWTIEGGEIDPRWRRGADALGYKPTSSFWEPSSRFTLYVIDGVVDVRLVSYGGVVWPTAWTNLFQVRGQGYGSATVITGAGLQLRADVLDSASTTHAGAGIS